MSEQRRRPSTGLQGYEIQGYRIEVGLFRGDLPQTYNIEDAKLPAGFDETTLAGHPQFKKIDERRLARLERSLRRSLKAKAAKGDQWSAQAKADLEKLRKAQEIRAWGAVVPGERIAQDDGDYGGGRPKRIYPDKTTMDLVIYQIGKGPFRVHVGMTGVTPGKTDNQTLNEILLNRPTTVINPQTLVQLINQQKPVQIHTQVSPNTKEMGEVYQIQEKTQ